MPTMLPLNGKYLIYGLAWIDIVNPKKEFTERTAISRGSQIEYYVKYVGKKIKYGLARRVVETVGKQPKGKLLSAALLFSDHLHSVTSHENSVLVHQLNDTDVAIVALLKGEPYLDVVIKFTELDSQLASLYQEGHSTFVVYGNIPDYAQHIISANDLLSANISAAAMVRFTDPIKKNRTNWFDNLCSIYYWGIQCLENRKK